jgi:hypothetical protein
VKLSRWFRVSGKVRGTETWIRPVVDGESADEARARFPSLDSVTVEELSPEQFRVVVSSFPRRREEVP